MPELASLFDALLVAESEPASEVVVEKALSVEGAATEESPVRRTLRCMRR